MSRLAILILSWAAIGLAVLVGQLMPPLGLVAVSFWVAGTAAQFGLAVAGLGKSDPGIPA